MEMRLLSAALEDEIEAAQSETLELIKTLCRIPAPSHREERRAPSSRNGWRRGDFPPKSTTQKTCDAAGAWRKAEKSPS